MDKVKSNIFSDIREFFERPSQSINTFLAQVRTKIQTRLSSFILFLEIKILYI